MNTNNYLQALESTSISLCVTVSHVFYYKSLKSADALFFCTTWGGFINNIYQCIHHNCTFQFGIPPGRNRETTLFVYCLSQQFPRTGASENFSGKLGRCDSLRGEESMLSFAQRNSHQHMLVLPAGYGMLPLAKLPLERLLTLLLLLSSDTPLLPSLE